jgi:hypothetical protein
MFRANTGQKSATASIANLLGEAIQDSRMTDGVLAIRE